MAGELEMEFLRSIANWLPTGGLLALIGWNWRLVQWQHRQDLALKELQGKVAEITGQAAKLEKIDETVQELRIGLARLSTMIQERLPIENGRRAADRRSHD